MILDLNTKKLQIVLGGNTTSNQVQWSANYIDLTNATGAASAVNALGLIGTTGATPVDMVPLSGVGHILKVTALTVYNNDTVSATVTLQYDVGGTKTILCKVGLPAGYTLQYSNSEQFEVIDTAGQTLTSSPAGGMKSVQILTSASATYTTPAGCKAILVEAQACGGGGGGTSTTAANAAVGGGGASGGYSRKYIFGPSPTYAYTMGTTGGTAGSSSAGTGGTGTDTVFGTSLCTAKGGLGGVGMAFGTTALFALGGAVATSGGFGDIIGYGGCGAPASRASGTVACSGAGAASAYGTGGNSLITEAAGNNATGYGAGGGGACCLGTTARAGGVGGRGLIIVTEFY